MKRPSRMLEQFRVDEGEYATRRGNRYGMFQVDSMRIMVSDGPEWEHVSVSYPNRCPTWDEICQVKGWFWKPDESAVQFHPAEDDHVNFHPHCLHLWRPVDGVFPKPPAILVGPKL